MLRKNVASQFVYLCAVKAADGTALTGATILGYRSIDGAAQASITGTITELANGQYKVALSQADVNGNDIGFHFTNASMIPIGITVVTTAADPTDGVRFGLTSLPNAAAEAAGGLYTRGTGAGQVAQDASGNLRANVDTIKTQTVTCAAGVTVLASVGTTATSTAQTGDSYGRIGAAGAGITALGDTRIANLDTTVSSRNATTPPTATQIADAVLGRDFAAVAGPASRSLINAARTLRNKVTIAAGTVTVCGEDDTTVIWTGAVTTDATALPITGIDPA
jgi:hypothetical protein